MSLPEVPGLAVRALAAAGLRLGPADKIDMKSLNVVLSASDLSPREKLVVKTGLEQSGRIDDTLHTVHALAGEQPPVIIKAKDLLRELSAAGLVRCHGEGGRTLSDEQLEILLAGKSSDQRIRLKTLCHAAGILPVAMAANAYGRPSSMIQHPF